MKKILFVILGLLLVAALGVVIYVELHFSEIEAVPVEMTEAEMQEACPQVFLTEAERQFAAEVIEIDGVRAAMISAQEVTNVSDPAVAALVEAYLPDMGEWMLTVYGPSVTLEGTPDAQTRVILQFADESNILKLYAKYEEKKGDTVLKSLYQNENGETYQKYVSKRNWFSYWRRGGEIDVSASGAE